MEYNNYIPAVEEKKKVDKTKFAEERKGGLFAKILEGSKKFIKDDIKDEDFLK
jgi:hypothetical protein